VFEPFAGRRFRRAAAGGVALAVVGVLLSAVPAVLEVDETVGLGVLFAARGSVSPPRDVVLVNISRDSAQAVGTDDVDEWPRSRHAALVEALSRAGAAAIAFDIIFEEPRPDDDAFADAVRRAGNVILAERVETEDVGLDGSGLRAVVDIRRQPVAQLKAAALATAPFTLPTVPVRLNQFWTFGRAAGDAPSLPVAALQVFLLPYYDEFAALLGEVRPALREEIAASHAAIGSTGDLGAHMRKIRAEFQRDPELAPALRAVLRASPDDQRGHALRVLVDLYGGFASRYLNLYGPPRTIRTIPYDLASTESGAADLKGKMIFVGFAEPRPTEEDDVFYSVFSQRTGRNLSGVEIGATAFANLLEQRSLEPLEMPVHLLLVLAWGLLLGAVVGSATRNALALAALAAGLYAAAAYWAFVVNAVWLPTLVPLFLLVPAAALAAVFLNYGHLNRERARIQEALGYYVPRALVNRLAEQSVTAATSRQLLHGSCLFTDAEEYTTVSEALRPEELAALMNDYYRVMFGVVERHGGLVSDTSGDSMVALWASARPDAGSRIHACRAALEIVEAVAEFNRGRGGLQLPTRVGLESGEVLLGNIGAEQRFEYRAIGDIVNTASRLQGLNRLLGTRVLLSDATLAGSPGLAARNVGIFLLRGKKTPVRVHEPFGFSEDVHPEKIQLGTSFAAALELFESQRWVDAERAFSEIRARFPDDGPSAFYVSLCGDYLRAPKPWIGAITVAVK
jgi:adenylate cyclase